MDVSPIRTEDGSITLHSTRFDVPYHSIYGAVEESLHVFICAGLQRLILDGSTNISILEIGFGTGLNALLTLFEAQRHPQIQFQYCGLEGFPLSGNVIADLEYTNYLNRPDLQAQFEHMHRISELQDLKIDNFIFCKEHIKFEDYKADNQFDLIYFDAFAPTTQPELWDENMMASMYAALKENGALVSYCAKGSFKRALKSAGFQLDPLPGPSKKREMTRAWKVPSRSVEC